MPGRGPGRQGGGFFEKGQRKDEVAAEGVVFVGKTQNTRRPASSLNCAW